MNASLKNIVRNRTPLEFSQGRNFSTYLKSIDKYIGLFVVSESLCYFCNKVKGDELSILHHTLDEHSDSSDKNFKILIKEFNDKIGTFAYISVQFPDLIRDLIQRKQDGYQIYISTKKRRLYFKRPPSTHSQADHNALYDLLPGVINKMVEMGRKHPAVHR